MEKGSTPQEHSTRSTIQSAFLVENIETLRARQFEVLNSDISDEDMNQQIGKLTDEYASEYGIEDESHIASLRQFGADVIDDTTWRYGEWKDEDDHDKGLGPIGRDFVHEAQVKHFSKRVDFQSTSDDPEGSPSDPEANPGDDAEDDDSDTSQKEYIDGIKTELEERQEEVYKRYAEMVAERSRSMIEFSDTTDNIDALKEEATDLIGFISTMMMDQLEAEGKSEDEIAQLVGVFVDEQASLLIGQMEEHRINEYEKTGGWRRKVLDKWAQWTDQSTDKETGKLKFFSAGTRKKILAMGVPGAAVGVAAGLTMPLWGVGAVGAGLIAGGALVARSVGRNLASGYLDKKSSEKKLATEQSEEMRAQYAASMEQSEQANRQTVYEVLDSRSKEYRKRNIIRTVGGAAVAGAAGFAGGAAASWAADHINFGGAVDWVQDKWQTRFGGGTPESTKVPSSVANSQAWDIDEFAPKTDELEVDPLPQPVGEAGTEEVDPLPRPVDGADTQSPETNQAPTTSDLLSDLSLGAQTITPGEGLFETFGEHNIPQENWQKLMEEAGPKLDDKYPKLVYHDSPSGEWRFGYAGELPRGASEIIYETARDNNLLSAAMTETATDTAVNPEVVVDKPFEIEHGHGYTHELIDGAKANDVVMTPEQAWENHTAIVDAHGSDYIDIPGVDPDVYSRGPSVYQTGLSAPTTGATWMSEAQPMVADAMDNGVIDGSTNVTVSAADIAPGDSLPPSPETPDTSEIVISEDARTIADSNLEGLEKMQPSADQAMWLDMSNDIDKTVDYLRSGELDALNADLDLRNTLSAISYDIGDMTYTNSDVPIMKFDTSSYRWMVNAMPEGSEVPQKAIETIQEYQKSLYTLAA